MRVVKSSGPVQIPCRGSPRTSPSPSASVDLAHLRPRPRLGWCTPATHPLSPRPRESPPHGPSYPERDGRRDRDAHPSIRDHPMTRTSPIIAVQGTPPFNVPHVGDG